MSQGKAQETALFMNLVCLACGVAATVLALLGIGLWPVLVVLALVALLVVFHFEKIKISQRHTRHGWNGYKLWGLLGVTALFIGMIGVFITLAFWLIRDSAGFDLFTLDGTGVTPAAYANLALVAIGMIVLARLDESKPHN